MAHVLEDPTLVQVLIAHKYLPDASYQYVILPSREMAESFYNDVVDREDVKERYFPRFGRVLAAGIVEARYVVDVPGHVTPPLFETPWS